jgi:hypothetical protein
MQHEEDGTDSMVVASSRPSRYFVKLKVKDLPAKTKQELNYVQSERIRHEILNNELKKDEILVAFNSERLKEMKVGAKLLLEGYTLFLDDRSLHPSHKAIKLNGRKGTAAGLPFPDKASNKTGEQGGAGQPATAPESKPEGGKNPKPESEGRPK